LYRREITRDALCALLQKPPGHIVSSFAKGTHTQDPRRNRRPNPQLERGPKPLSRSGNESPNCIQPPIGLALKTQSPLNSGPVDVCSHSDGESGSTDCQLCDPANGDFAHLLNCQRRSFWTHVERRDGRVSTKGNCGQAKSRYHSVPEGRLAGRLDAESEQRERDERKQGG
jgi:hypothetical protein